MDMEYEVATKMRELYPVFPKNRAGQLALIVQYNQLTQNEVVELHGKPIFECPNPQIYAVAINLYKQAHHWEEQECAKNWEDNLYDIFNIPKEQREEISPSELEERLLGD